METVHQKTMDKFSQETRWAVGTFANVDEPEAQNALLHQIFTRILSSKATNRHINVFEEVVMTLYRLFLDQEWEPARTFFYMLTGTLINPDRPVLSIDFNLYFRVGYASYLHLDPRTINGECDKTCSLLNVLWFNAEEYYDDDSDADSDDDSSEYSSTSSSSGAETLSSRGSSTSGGSNSSDSASTISASDSASSVGSKQSSEHNRRRHGKYRTARSSRSSHRRKCCGGPLTCMPRSTNTDAELQSNTPPPLTNCDTVE